MLHVVVELRRPAAPAAELIGNSAKRKKCKIFSHVLLAVLYGVCVLLATSTVAQQRESTSIEVDNYYYYCMSQLIFCTSFDYNYSFVPFIKMRKRILRGGGGKCTCATPGVLLLHCMCVCLSAALI